MENKIMKQIHSARRQKTKLSVTQLIRHGVQIAGFLLMPGLFLLTLGSVRGLWRAVLSGSFTWTAMGAPLLTLLAVIPITALWGRFFCGYLCAFGGLQELTDFIGEKCGLPRLEPSPAADRILRKGKYAVLAVLFLLWTLDIAYDAFSPWRVFGQYASFDGWSEPGGWLTWGGLFLLLIAVGSLFTPRAFCRYLCPLGGIFSLISRWRFFNVRKNAACVGCGHCGGVCPMGIDVCGADGRVTSPECIDCFRCVDNCAPRALSTSPREAVAGSVAAVAIAGLYQVGTIAVNSPIGTVSGGTALSQGQYIDGTYQGTAQGYRGAVNVSVTVSGGNITSVTVESYADDDEFFNRAKNTVISEILSAQSADVAAVSGATYSSRGIINAVADALGVTPSVTSDESSPAAEHATREGHGSGRAKRRRSSDSSDNSGNSQRNGGLTPDNAREPEDSQSSEKTENTENLQNSQNQENTASDFANLSDGTYSGSGQGRNGSIAVSVTVRGGKVTSITVESSREDAQYFNRAKDTVIGEILSSQSLNVPTVSGATMSSNGILDAVANALGISFTNPNPNSRLSNQGHGRR